MQFIMRRAAFAAGLTTEINDPSLVLCLEPEGACFAALAQAMVAGCRGGPRPPPSISLDFSADDCLAGPDGSSTTDDDDDDDGEFCDVGEALKDDVRGRDCDIGAVLLTRGSRFVVLDAGGGTVDIASFEVVAAHSMCLFKVKQLAAPVGAKIGSTQVDEQFMQLLRYIIGNQAYAAMHEQHRDVELEVRRAWETIKINARRGEPGQLQLASLQSDVLDPMGPKLSTLIETYNMTPGLRPEPKGATRMVLPAALLESLFEPSIHAILDLLTTYLDTPVAGTATHVLLAGGYAASPYLWDALVEHVSRRVASGGKALVLYKLNEPDLAILKGACIYGTAHRERVESRVSKWTYGEEVMARFNPADPAHQARLATVVEDHRGVRYLPTFAAHVSVGQVVPVGLLSPRALSVPLLDTSTVVDKVFLASTGPRPRFPDEPGVVKVATYTCPLEMALPFDARGVEVQYEFGGTELKVHAYRRHDGKKVGSVQATFL